MSDTSRVRHPSARVLRSGGVFVLDTANQVSLVRGFRPQAWHELEDGTLWLENRTHDLVSGRSQAHWTFVKGDRRRELSFDHRVYTIPEYGELLRRSGFDEIEVTANMDGREVTSDAWRIQIVARRG